MKIASIYNLIKKSKRDAALFLITFWMIFAQTNSTVSRLIVYDMMIGEMTVDWERFHDTQLLYQLCLNNLFIKNTLLLY